MKTHEMQKRMRISFTGVGGQGTLTATTLLARTALEAGLDVVAGEVHGMAQRGGVVESVMLLGFEPLETLRALPYLQPGGAIFSSSDALPPLSVALGKAEYPDMPHIMEKARQVAGQCHFVPCRELGIKAGSVQSGNTVLLSVVCSSGVLPFGVDALEAAIKKFLPAKLQESNLKALELGKAYVNK